MVSSDDLRTLTVEEAAAILAVRPEAVRIWIREGTLEAMRWGRRLRIRPEALRAFQDARRVRSSEPLRLSSLLRSPRGGRRA